MTQPPSTIARKAARYPIAVPGRVKGFGTVKVMLGKKTLKKVSLAHKRNVKKKVIAIATFPTPVNGKVTVQVVSQGKKVVVEGLGIATG